MQQWSLCGALAGLVPFLLALWDFGFRPLRTAGAHRFASNVYDLQARAFLDGDLAVPADSLGIEGFVVDGRTYMYFPPFPALLRVPVLMLTNRFDGRLTTLSMLFAWSVLAVATALLFWNVRLLLRPDARVRRIEGVAAVIFITSVTGGSVVVFDAALPWVYHEVYVWAAALAVGALAGLVALARQPRSRTLALTVGCVVGAILTRTTTGWALAITLIVAGLLVVAFRSKWPRPYGAGLVLGGVIALGAGVAFNWAKFRHPFMFPLEHQVWTAENSRRRLALLMNDGSITGPQFFRSSLVNYFRPDGIRFVSYFPFVTLPAQPARSYGGAFLDQTYRTGSVPAFMPLLFVATLWGFVATALTRPLTRLVALVVPLLGALMICAGVMGYGYLANRYTSEFVPVLAIGSAIGIVDVARRIEQRSGWLRRCVAAAAASLLLFGVFANTAVGLTAARTTWRGQQLVNYVATQRSFAHLGIVSDPPASRSEVLPENAPADTLHIVGDCDALYIATGDQYEPWILVEARPLMSTVTVEADRTRRGIARLFTVEGARTRNVTLETSASNRMRLRIGEGWTYLPTDWLTVAPGDRVEVTVTADTERDRFRISVSALPDEFVAGAEWNARWRNVVAMPNFAVPPVEFVNRLGVSIEERRGPAPRLCAELLDDLGD